ncbi:RidA family protein [Gloeobacter kilaueensis]|uniref:Endoribonuclease L-PSP n=1 Tax=Gloeobacter kilaueensis (strain ATCC BAA-2537 / CCAP 1431/1 / ULC 316 / JS1) TaxID=1183438 RepID=U5QCI8_GLOK1|nr:RidA family protein [Gloeobacter kilaueensis]AGY56591.1 endoribonuclease L-PSP [Gloeobacter kilaueensis JS1]
MQTIRGEGNQGPYSQSVLFGDLVFTAGQIPVIPTTGEIVAGGIEEQAAQAFTNLQAVLNAAGTDFDRVLKVTVFLTDMDDFAGLNRVYQSFFTEHLPARSCVAVAALPRGVKVEVEAIAAKSAN